MKVLLLAAAAAAAIAIDLRPTAGVDEPSAPATLTRLDKPDPAPALDAAPIRLGGGVTHVDVVLGGLETQMTLDTGASTSSITAWLANKLVASGQAVELRSKSMVLADGSQRPFRVISVKTLTLGSHTESNVEMLVSDRAMQLLGFPILSAIGAFTIDSVHRQIIFNATSQSLPPFRPRTRSRAAP
jgi:aspartyl protease